MRIYFQNLDRPKRAAKVLASTLSRQLSVCQQALAHSCGYRDWHDLETSHADAIPSAPDETLSTERYVERHVTLIAALHSELNASCGDCQHALSACHLTGSRRPDPLEQLEVRLHLLRKFDLPVAGRRKCGEIGRAKALGPTGKQVILREYGRPTRVITHKSADGGVADFEYTSPRDPLPLFIPMRLYLLYGAWREADGAEVLYSRDYLPLWRIRPGCAPERLPPWLWIPHVSAIGFWDDTSTPWSHPSRYKLEIERLRQYRLPSLPMLVDVLPIVVHDGAIRSFKDAAFVLKKLRIPPQTKAESAMSE